VSTNPLPCPYIVDVCGTLVRDDTTLGLLRHHFARMGQRRMRLYILTVLTAKASPLRIACIVLEKLLGRHLLKHLLVSMLAGDRDVDLDISAIEYAKYLVEHRRVANVWEKLCVTSRHEQIILASASLEPVVKALAKEIKSRYVSSTLESRNGTLTGRYQEDLTGNKVEGISKKYGPEVLTGSYIAFSDNLTDFNLLRQASKAYVILHQSNHRKRWCNLNAEFVSLDE